MSVMKGDFVGPMPERIATLSFRHADEPPSQILSVGIKTLTHNRAGMKVYQHKAVVIEISEGDEVASVALSPSHARAIAQRISEFADTVETEKAS